MNFSNIQNCRTALDNREISAIELAQYFFKRIEQHNPNINAFLDTNWESTEKQAQSAQQELDKHHQNGTKSHILTGIPLAHKDVFVTKDWKTTAASKMLANYKSPFDAHIVQNFLDVKTVCLGKLNMDEFAMGSTNENSAFGAVKNPWHLDSVAGGSSGGSAAAVAANLAPFVTGSDTGGSIRQPAAYCGITGLKPTYGSTSRYGMIAYASSLDQAGIMAKSSHDVAILLNTLIGFDERDSTSLQRVHADYSHLLNQPLAGKKIGIPVEFLTAELQSEIGLHIDIVSGILEKLGAQIVKINLPRPELSIPAYYVLASAEASTNLSRYDGVRYGHRANESDIQSLDDLYRKSRSEGFGEEVKRRVLTGAYVLSQGFYDAYYRQAQRVRQQIYLDYQQALSNCDVILSPTAPTTAPLLNSQNKDPMMMYLADIYTLGTNLAGLPALSFPVGFDNIGKPIGLQLIGKAHSEPLLLNVAHQFQQVNDVHLQIPETFIG